MVVLAMIYTRTFYGFTYLFHRLPIKPHFRPGHRRFPDRRSSAWASITLLRRNEQQVLAVLSFGYGVLQEAMRSAPAGEGEPALLAVILLAIALGKILTTGLTIGSGGSGGVFGPSMVIGGCGGGALGIVPAPALAVARAASGQFRHRRHGRLFRRRRQDAVLHARHRQRNDRQLQPLVPTLWVCALTFLLSDEQSIYSSQVESRSRSPAHQGDYVRDVLTGLHVQPISDVPASNFRWSARRTGSAT